MASYNKSSRLGLAFFILLLGAGVTLFFTVFQKYLVNRAGQLRQAIETVKSKQEFARIRVLSRGNGVISYRLSVLDQDGQVQAKGDYTIPGDDLFIEARIVYCQLEEESKAFVFPWRMYSDRVAPDKGTDIRGLGVEQGFPLNYRRQGQDDTWVNTLKDIYATAFEESEVYAQIRDQYIKDVYDSSLHMGILGKWEAGKDYICIIHPNGALELLEE